MLANVCLNVFAPYAYIRRNEKFNVHREYPEFDMIILDFSETYFVAFNIKNYILLTKDGSYLKSAISFKKWMFTAIFRSFSLIDVRGMGVLDLRAASNISLI